MFCAATHWSVQMSDTDVGSAGCGCEQCRREITLYIREHDGQSRRVCMTCRRALDKGMGWELPKDAAIQTRGARPGRPQLVPRSALRDITRSARTNGNTPSEGVHAQASATVCQSLPHPRYMRPLRVGQQARQTASHRVRGEAPCQVPCVAALVTDGWVKARDLEWRCQVELPGWACADSSLRDHLRRSGI
jgi:hypothetical protein